MSTMGVVVLDANGEAVVELPEWFEPLNTDFRLDDNRGNAALAATVSAGLSAFISPLIGQPVVVTGRVLSHPSIHNLYWDDDWDAHNTGSAGPAPTVAAIDGFTTHLGSPTWFRGSRP